MYALGKPEPVTKELLPARDDRPAVRVTFNPRPSPLSLRAARRAVAEEIRAGGIDAMERAGDVFSAAIIRHNILSWEGIVDADDRPIVPTPDRELPDPDAGEGAVRIEPGTISAFMAEPRLVEAADREYVLPWSIEDAEKNGWRPLPSGTGEAAAPAVDIASSSAKPKRKGAVGTSKPARKRARTTSTSRKPTPAKPSGS